MIVERTQEGKALAKQDPDFREGRPKIYSNRQIEHAISLKETDTHRHVKSGQAFPKAHYPIQTQKRAYITHVDLK